MNIEDKLQQAISLHQAGQLQQAERKCQQILRNSPQHADALHLLGVIAYQVGENNVATGLITQAIKIDSNQCVFFNSLGSALQEQGRLEESIQAYQQAIHIRPDYAEAYNNLGNALQEQGRLEESIQAYQKVLEIQPNHPEAYNNLGVVLKEQGRLEESIQAYQKVLEIQPDCAEACSNLGNALREQGRLEESIQACQQAIHLQPDCAEAHKNLGIILLLRGDLLQGWKEYEWRLKCDDITSTKRVFPQPAWDGTNLNGKSILIWTRQGIGDEVMFVSMLDNLRQMSANIIIECKERLVPLFQRSFPDTQFVLQENPPNLQLLNPDIDYQIPIGSLGQWLRTDEDSFKQSKQPYLTACTNRSAKIKTRYQILAAGKLLVGISWKSTGINQRRALLKSTMLEDWTSILSQQDCCFINLQYGDVKEELEQFQQQTDLMIYQDEEIDSLRNLDDFAAQVSALDLVISIDNTTVHMAGALGKQVWTLLPYIPDWRWMLEREDTPWYPSMRLFRQNETGDWSGIFAQVRLELEQYMVDNTAE
ncbi:TPA: tetratricopeptide repeat protein [Candidatus Poribacteria bacterium]|nr:tetratricopeptide repeat protein [Candidatus Poribacteria bacterium]